MLLWQMLPQTTHPHTEGVQVVGPDRGWRQNEGKDQHTGQEGGLECMLESSQHLEARCVYYIELNMRLNCYIQTGLRGQV